MIRLGIVLPNSLCLLGVLAFITLKTYYRLAVNSYPETRHRYWNGYMLFYESTDKLKYDTSNDSRGNLVRQDAVMEGQR